MSQDDHWLQSIPIEFNWAAIFADDVQKSATRQNMRVQDVENRIQYDLANRFN